MPFLHPAIFWTGLAAVSLPIIIHLLNRRRFKIRDWAAMKFLLDSIRKNRRRLRIEEMILLAIRCLAVGLLGMAIGRFTGCDTINKATSGIMPQAQQNVVFIVDDTVSMGQQLGAGTLFKESQAEVSRQVDQLRNGDRVACLLVSQPKEASHTLEVLSDKESFKTQLASLACSDMRGRLEETLSQAHDLLAKIDGPDKKVVILSDFRAIDLQPAERQAAMRTQYDNLRKDKIQIVALDYGRACKVNLSVKDLSLVDKLVLAGERAKVAITIQNFGDKDVRNFEVGLSLNSMVGGQMTERALDSLKVDEIKAGDWRRIEFEVKVLEPGAAILTARLPGADADGSIDELRGDDKASLAMDARSMMRVLVVDGLPPTGTDVTQGEAYILSRVIDPNQDGGHGVRAQVEPKDVIKDLHFDDYDLVIMMNVDSMPIEQVTRLDKDGKSHTEPGCPKVDELKTFVRNGGGLVIFTGEKVDPAFWNKYLYEAGSGLTPFAIGDVVTVGKAGTPYEKTLYFRLDPSTIEVDPLLEVFQGDGKGFCDVIQFLSFNKALETPPTVTSADAKPPRVLVRFNDNQGTSASLGSPAIVSRQFGLGSVLCFFTAGTSRPQPRGQEWNNWPKAPMDTYNLVMLDMLPAYGRPQPKMTDLVGRDFEFQLPGMIQQAAATIQPPKDKFADVISINADSDDKSADGQATQSRLVCKDTRWAGDYEMEVDLGGTKVKKFFTRMVDYNEGNLQPGGKSGLEIAFGGKDFVYVAKSSEEAADKIGDYGKEYWLWVMAAVLMLLAAEIYFGQRFGHYTN